MQKEIWKDIEKFKGYYQISKCGKLKSFKQLPNGRVLSNTNKNGDYLSIVLSAKDCDTRYVRMHIIVYEHFKGHIPKGSHIHHKDGNKQNNHIDNLECLTVKEHRQLTVREHPEYLKGMINYNTTIRPNVIIQLSLSGEYIAEYKNGKIASELTGVCSRNILQVANKEEYKPWLTRKQAGGYRWEYK